MERLQATQWNIAPLHHLIWIKQYKISSGWLTTSHHHQVHCHSYRLAECAVKVTNSISGVGFFLNGALLSNNSVLTLRDTGEGSSALYCVTDRPLCCGAKTGGANRGLWRFPYFTTVSQDTAADIYWTRGFSSIHLNRRSSAVRPTGVYTCLIPDGRNVVRTLYIGLYDSNSTGEY
jgi:hypothetical protein